ncbi:MAG TPA: mannose-1-phosphate guanylyltransferase, partial [Candidatus Limnocylindrales bacterium]|nr:mannose-1-phosphate guanylyltransferase [Candidatus Limnocylindrales bacterium]
MYVVILAGGGGTRLWPLSRQERPKPFLPLVDDRSLLQHTVDRIAPLVGSDDVFCVADRRYGQLIRDQVPDVGLIVEPAGRNTAAAIALAGMVIDRPDDEVMIVLPADHWIADEARFRDVLRVAAERLATGSFEIEQPLVTLGVRPTFPSTDYGYLRPDTMRGTKIDGVPANPLLGFEEKPTEARARELINLPGIAWNAGMFAWQRSAIRAALEKYTPLPMLIDQAVGSELALANAYERIAPISIDRAVMESAAADHRVVMGAMDVGWSDLGSWTALLAAIAGDRVAGATGRVVQPGETIQLGPDDLVVRPADGHLTVEVGPTVAGGSGGTIVADGVWAHLAGARHLIDEVRGLLERVDHHSGERDRGRRVPPGRLDDQPDVRDLVADQLTVAPVGDAEDVVRPDERRDSV